MATLTLPRGTPPAGDAGWSLGRRIVFRFFCWYLLFSALPMASRVSLVDPIPGARVALRPIYQDIWRAFSPWAAIHIFNLSGRATTYFPTGSTDTTLGYIQNLWYVVIACVATLVWSVVDRKRPDYRALHDWLRVLVRYTLAIAMFTYGIGKVFPNQFLRVDGDYGIARQIEPYGQFSPMGVLWTFMGTSRPYTIFTGIVELTGCVFLLFRRTATLGALVSAAALINVIVLDFCFDIDVKLGALNYLLMAIFLLAPDVRRLVNLLVLNRATSPAVFQPLWPARRWASRTMVVCKALFITALVVPGIQWAWQNRQVARPKGPLYGIYDVEKFVENGRERPALATESGRWSKVALVDFAGTAPGSADIRNSDDTMLRYQSVDAPDNPQLTWSDIPFFSGSNRTRFVFSYSRPDADHLVLQNDQLAITMRRMDQPYPLFTRGFHWIIETPFNR
jgi:uncharacterized membrane protein YphA (DoxX/SURF4 family)